MHIATSDPKFVIREATKEDVPLILSFIRELAEYEKLSHDVVATAEILENSLFGERRYAEVIIGYYEDTPVGYALFFHNFSTFLGRQGMYLEDLYVQPAMRGKGLGKILLSYVARLAKERDCGRLEWVVLDWNEPALKFYDSIGAKPMEGWIIERLDGEALQAMADKFSDG